MVGLTLPVTAPADLPGPVVGAPVLSLATAAGLTIIMVAAVGVSGLSGPFMRNDLVRWRLPSMLYRPWYPRSLEPPGKGHSAQYFFVQTQTWRAHKAMSMVYSHDRGLLSACIGWLT